MINGCHSLRETTIFLYPYLALPFCLSLYRARSEVPLIQSKEHRLFRTFQSRHVLYYRETFQLLKGDVVLNTLI